MRSAVWLVLVPLVPSLAWCSQGVAWFNPPTQLSNGIDRRHPSVFDAVPGELVAKNPPSELRSGGLVLHSWRLPSEQDLRNFAAMLGVGDERAILLDPILERYLSRWQEIDRTYLPRLEELAGPASPYAPPHPERPTPPSASALFHETRCEMLTKRSEAEAEVVSAIVVLAEQPDDADRAAIAAVKARFEAARSRARAAELSQVAAARLDLGLLVKEVAGETWDFDVESKESALIEAYWREMTPPSERAVNGECRNGPRKSALWMEMWELRPNAPPEIGSEFRELCKTYYRPSFDRARINLEWTPRIAALLPEAKRSEFIATARAMMFPRFLGNWPEGRARGQKALRDALEIPSLDTEQKERILALAQEIDRRIEEIDQRLIASWITYDRVGCNLQNQRDLPEPIDLAIDRLHAERDKKQAEAIRIVERILTPSQFKLLTVELPPLGPDEVLETVPGPDGKHIKRRVKREDGSLVHRGVGLRPPPPRH